MIYLKEKIRTIFNLGRSTCKVSWKDEDGDDVTIETDEELLIALQELNGPVYKLQVIKGPGLLPEAGQSQETSKNNNNKGEEHFGVTCDSCDGSIRGFRYKCMVSVRGPYGVIGDHLYEVWEVYGDPRRS